MATVTDATRIAYDVRTGAASAELRLLPWDSDFFGARMGIVAGATLQERAPEGAYRDLMAGIIDTARRESFAHLIARAPASDWAFVRAAEGVGMRLVDAGIDLVTTPRAEADATGDVRVRVAREDDLEWATGLAAAAFTHSRFWADPYFSAEQARAFHRTWVTNLWHGLAQRVFVAETSAGRLGFNACGLAEGDGRIILIGTDATARRSGVGRALVEAALGWFQAEGAQTAHVKTQAANLPALALYGRAGFIVETTELTYSWSA